MAIALATVAIASGIEAAEPAVDGESLSLEPKLDVEVRQDDNIFRSATDVTSSLISIVSPGLSLVARPSRHRFALQYQGDFAWYADSEPDNYEDHYFEAGAYLALGEKGKFDIVGSYKNAHDDRGTGLTEGFIPALDIPAEPDEYELAEILGRFGLGREASTGRLVFEAGHRDLEYSNHLDRTRYFSRRETYGDGIFYFRVKPKTSLLLDARYTEIAYANDRPLESSLNSNEARLLFGVAWDTTAKIGGSVKLGYVKKTFDDSARGDFSNPSWEVAVRLSPMPYSHFDIGTARYPAESNAGGNFIDNTSYSAAWTHEWDKRLQSKLGAKYIEQDYQGSPLERKQDLTQYEFFLIYKMRNWLSWKAGVEVRSRDSNIDVFVFDRTVYSLTLSLAP